MKLPNFCFSLSARLSKKSKNDQKNYFSHHIYYRKKFLFEKLFTDKKNITVKLSDLSLH